MSYPKIPKGSISPFEQRLQMRAQEIRPRQELGGCGDIGCPICYPKNGMGETRMENDSSRPRRDEIDSFVKAVEERMYMNMGVARESRANDESKLNSLRKQVKDYVCTFDSIASVSFDDVIGNDKAKQALLEAVEHPYTHADIYAAYNMKPLKGVLLWGPPGCGKTMFAKAAAKAVAKGNAKAEMLIVNGAELQSPFVGVSEETIRNLFAFAAEYKRMRGQPCVIFIDEADAILPPRNGGMRWDVSNVSTFLAEMDGIEDSGAFIILATNRPENIDEALLRDGRCDRKIKVERPGLEAAVSILRKSIYEIPLKAMSEDVDAEAIVDYILNPARRIVSFTAFRGDGAELDQWLTLGNILNGAMLVGIVQRAKSIAFARDIESGNLSGVQQLDFILAVDAVVEDNKGIRHDWAVREMMETLNLREQAMKNAKLN